MATYILSESECISSASVEKEDKQVIVICMLSVTQLLLHVWHLVMHCLVALTFGNAMP